MLSIPQLLIITLNRSGPISSLEILRCVSKLPVTFRASLTLLQFPLEMKPHDVWWTTNAVQGEESAPLKNPLSFCSMLFNDSLSYIHCHLCLLLPRVTSWELSPL